MAPSRMIRRRFGPAIAVTCGLALVVTAALIASIGPGPGAADVSHGASAQPVGADVQCKEGESSLVRTLNSGNSWSLCWNVDYRRGLVLQSVGFQESRQSVVLPVLDEIGLSQLNVAYDDGLVEYNDATSYGFGGASLQPFTEGSCAGGDILDVAVEGDSSSIGGLCVAEQSYGPSYLLHDDETYTGDGSELVLTIQSKINWYEYFTQYRLRDDGQIDVQLGASGDLSPHEFTDSDSLGSPVGDGQTNRAVNHFHSAIWKVLFNVGGGGTQTVERTVSGPANGKVETSSSKVENEAAFTLGALDKFRVVNHSSLNADSHPRSYDILMGHSDPDTTRSPTDYDIAFSQRSDLEVFANDNLASIPGATKDAVPDFVSDKEPLTDPVAWVNVGFHHLTRDEDQSPMPTHWQGFSLAPRDFFAQSPLTPDSRQGVNGRDQSPLSKYLPAGVRLNESGGYVSPPADPRMPDATSGNVATYARVLARDFYRIEGQDSGDIPGNVTDNDSDTVWAGDTLPPTKTITLEWPRLVTINGSEIVWVSRGASGGTPESYTLDYLNEHGEWLPLSSVLAEQPDSSGKLTSQVSFDPVVVRALRVTASTDEDTTVAISEWQVTSAE